MREVATFHSLLTFNIDLNTVVLQRSVAAVGAHVGHRAGSGARHADAGSVANDLGGYINKLIFSRKEMAESLTLNVEVHEALAGVIEASDSNAADTLACNTRLSVLQAGHSGDTARCTRNANLLHVGSVDDHASRGRSVA